MEDWTPAAAGPGATPLGELPRISRALAPYRNDIMMLTGLTSDAGREHGDGGGDHARAGAAYLTCAHPRKTYGKDIRAGISMDQIAARHFEGQTRFGSLELGCEEGIQGGNCDNGYSCAYSNSLSWRTETTPNPPEIRPRAVFERHVRSRRTMKRTLRGGSDLAPFERASSISLLDEAQEPDSGAGGRRSPQARRIPVRRARHREAIQSAEREQHRACPRRRAVSERPGRFRRALRA